MADEVADEPATGSPSESDTVTVPAADVVRANAPPAAGDNGADTVEVNRAVFAASLYPKDRLLPGPFVTGVKLLEASLGMPVWFMVQDGEDEEEYDSISRATRREFFSAST